jgi:predicted nucleotide-binding protein
VELPSDISGVLYTPLDPSGAWMMELAREMIAAGIDLDLNRAVRPARTS